MLSENFPELAVHPSALLIQAFAGNDEKEKRCCASDGKKYVARAAFSIKIAPIGSASVNLGVSIMAPIGTYLTISPEKNAYKQPWQIANYRLGRDERGEATSEITNCTSEIVVVTTDTVIGQINVLRIRKSNKITTRAKMDKKK